MDIDEALTATRATRARVRSFASNGLQARPRRTRQHDRRAPAGIAEAIGVPRRTSASW